MNGTTESDEVLERFLAEVKTLRWREARLLDVWDEETVVPGLPDANRTAQALLRDEGGRARREQWEDLSDRLELPRWDHSHRETDRLVEGIRPLVEQTMLAIFLGPALGAGHFEAMTAAWRAIIGPVAGRAACV